MKIPKIKYDVPSITKHVPPDIRHNRIPATEMSFSRPNLLVVIREIDIAIEYDRLGLTPEQIIDAHPHLTLEAIHDALSYYYENRSMMDEEIKKRRDIIKGIAQKIPSVLKEKIG